MTKSELMELEREFWSNTNDPQYFADHMVDGALAVIGDEVETKERAVKSTGESNEKWTNFKMQDARVLSMGDCGAAIVYKGSADLGDRHYEARVTSVYVMEDGRYKLALTTHHQTSDSGTPAAADRR